MAAKKPNIFDEKKGLRFCQKYEIQIFFLRKNQNFLALNANLLNLFIQFIFVLSYIRVYSFVSIHIHLYL